ncbi:MAG: DEAD/DEAH box helicase, partial [Chloroflexi bacterium]|nr:DEAD/DEAH box helicase [Chloroflexota bacterium]
MTDSINLSGLLPRLRDQAQFAALRRDLDGPHDGVLQVPLLRAARAAMLAALIPLLDRPVMLVAARPDRAQALHDSLRAFGLNSDRLFRFPEPSALFYEHAPWPREVAAERLNVLSQLASIEQSAISNQQSAIVVTSVRALMYRTLPPRAFKLGTRTLRRGQSISLDQLLEVWVGFGYESTTTVLAPGEFSRRGGIVDVFPPALPRPVRIEFFGDEVESLRAFDPATQRSLDALDQISVTPAAECLAKNGPVAAEQIKSWDTSNLPDDQATQFEKDRLALIAGAPFRGIEFYLPLLHGDATALIDYVPRNALIVLDDAEEIEDAWSELEEQALDLRHSAEDAGTLPPNFPLPYVTWDEWHEKVSHRSTLSLSDSSQTLDDQAPAERLPLSPGPRFGGQLKTFIEHLAQLRGLNDAAIVVSRQASRLAELWAEHDHLRPPTHSVIEPPEPRALIFVQGLLDEGWTLRAIAPRDEEERRSVGLWSLHVLTDAEIFGWARPLPRRRGKPRAITPEQFFADLQPGDTVVHVDHGIGLFQGLIKLTLDGVENEYLQLAYAGGDKLYVPIHQADRLSKYIGADDHSPDIHRLGTADWSQVRSKAKEAALEVARELLELYASRELAPGYAYSPDSTWQNELEASFAYIETDDQLRAIREVKGDMEKARPMDRLICGDVGYGKTEVALRAAFKAVQDGKQVAVLVPTTVLAQQHFVTFCERLETFPVKVEMLSRFVAPPEQKGIAARIAAGDVDVVVGTHRVLQSDVRFRDLGLL